MKLQGSNLIGKFRQITDLFSDFFQAGAWRAVCFFALKGFTLEQLRETQKIIQELQFIFDIKIVCLKKIIFTVPSGPKVTHPHNPTRGPRRHNPWHACGHPSVTSPREQLPAAAQAAEPLEGRGRARRRPRGATGAHAGLQTPRCACSEFYLKN